MKRVLIVLGVGVGLFVIVAVGFLLWAGTTSRRVLARTIDTHSVDFPIPFPIDPTEREALGLSDREAADLALQRATERAQHLIEARYGCTECHGTNFGGGVMVDAFPLGTILGPNLTSGAGGRVGGFRASDWDRAVRHGVLSDGRPSVMPAMDFQRMSDQELSDIIAYIQSQPPVDNDLTSVKLGPLGKLLVATGQMALSADLIVSHSSAHLLAPPAAEATVEFGEHLAGVCTGCHGPELAGGPITGGDPAWPPARNITPHQTGLGGWSYADFIAVMRDSRRPDGTPLLEPMTFMVPAAQQMTDIELEAIWAYLESIPPVERAIE